VLKLAVDVYKVAKKLWSDDIPQRPSPRRDKTAYEVFNNLTDNEEEDELQQYLSMPRLTSKATKDPLKWWIDNQSTYPVLSYLALELIAAPSFTAASERLFSTTSNVINEDWPMIQQEIAEAVQCLWSFFAERII